MTLSITPERSAALMHGVGCALHMSRTTTGPTFDYLEEFSILLESTMSTLRSSLDKLESDIIEHEGRGQTRPSDGTMRAILLSLVPENLEEHLELNIQHFDTYTKMRTEVVSFLEQKASKVDDWGAQPMDLDYVQGKGKGKTQQYQTTMLLLQQTWSSCTRLSAQANQSLQTLKRVQRVSPRVRKDPQKDLPKERQRQRKDGCQVLQRHLERKDRQEPCCRRRRTRG